MIDTSSESGALAPLVVREIVYRLLAGAQGSRLRHLATFGGQAHRMVRAVEKLRENFDKPLRIEDLARELAMSVSGFHAHFKAVTAISPLQFQKQLRLREARRLMLSENLDAAEAAYRVGYDDAGCRTAARIGRCRHRSYCGRGARHERVSEKSHRIVIPGIVGYARAEFCMPRLQAGRELRQEGEQGSEYYEIKDGMTQ